MRWFRGVGLSVVVLVLCFALDHGVHGGPSEEACKDTCTRVTDRCITRCPLQCADIHDSPGCQSEECDTCKDDCKDTCKDIKDECKDICEVRQEASPESP